MMIKTMRVEGMHCSGCEGRLKKKLEELPQVREAVCSHVDCTAVVTLKEDISDEVLKETAEAGGFKVVGID